ncbi:membrane-bound lysozyme inhibitor of C-type lysozyme [Salmonella enterica subsp. enterica serovar Choleraesuis]|nr:membrane-bound lysozyme inhibitor of C-type lysozyme [Salmonella enterica subsp. enterica serovar Choleraesuis]
MIKKIFSPAAAIIGILFSSHAFAAVNAIPLPGKGSITVESFSYRCQGVSQPLKVTYYTKGDNYLAMVPVQYFEKEESAALLFAGMVSASGTSYGAHQYTWSGKDKDWTLENDFTNKSVNCKQL